MAKHIEVGLGQLFLDEANPRFDPKETEADAIAALCASEKMVEIAEDIVRERSLNPLELIGVVLRQPPRGRRAATYIVHEGNRRIAAMKLVMDPSLAPSNLQAQFRMLDKDALPRKIYAFCADSKADLAHWVELLHLRDDNPAGRRSWSPEAQGRHSGRGRAKRNAELMARAVDGGWATAAELRGKASILNRFMSNPNFRHHVGARYIGDDLTIHDDATFEREMKALTQDIISGRVTTRYNKAEIEGWAANRISAGHPPATTTAASTSPRASRPRQTRPRHIVASHLPHSRRIEDELEQLGEPKLSSLYSSLCRVEVEHTALLTVGWWSFLESLVSRKKGNSNGGFESYLNEGYLGQSLGFRGRKVTDLRTAISALYAAGNATKHSGTAALVDGHQLQVHVSTLEDLVVRLAQLANGNHNAKDPWP